MPGSSSSSQGGAADELRIDVCAGNQQSHHKYNHSEDLAPFIDHVQLLGHGALLARAPRRHDMQGIVFIAGYALAPDEKRQYYQGEYAPHDKQRHEIEIHKIT